MNLSINRVIMLHTNVVLFMHRLILLKGYVIMLKSLVILSTKHVNLSIQHDIILNVCCFVQTVSYCVKRLCYYVKCAGRFAHIVSYQVKRLCYYIKNRVILFTKHVNLSVNVFLC